MTVFAQSADMSFFLGEYNRPVATFVDRLEVLQTVRDLELTGIGEFYHETLRILLLRFPDVRTIQDRQAIEASARIICQALAAEKHTPAAADLWQTVMNFDIVRDFDGFVMQDALIALGQVGATDHVAPIVHRLTDFNTRETSDVETRRRVQRAVVGAIDALTELRDPAGFRPVFFVANGWYDPQIRNIASEALPQIVDDPGEIISQIIRDTSVTPPIKLMAWREMLRSNAPDPSIATVAAHALATGWSFATSNVAFQRDLRDMRMSAIDTIRVLGVQDISVYADLERSYSRNFVNPSPNYDEIRLTLSCLSAIGTDEAVDLLLGFLRELHLRRQRGPWAQRERQVMQMVLPAIGASGTESQDVRMLLTTIQRSSDYTGAEQIWARDALRQLGF
jgi:HEAT repeat protein